MQGWWLVSFAVLWLLVGTLCVVVVALARQIGTLHLRLGPRGALEIDDEGPPLGEAAPPKGAFDIHGHEVFVGGPGNPQLIMFVSPGCRSCSEVLPGLGAVAKANRLMPVVVSDGDRDRTINAYAGYEPRLAVIPDERIVRLYAIPGTPYVVVTDETGVVRAKGTANNLEQLEGLVDSARRRGVTVAAGS